MYFKRKAYDKLLEWKKLYSEKYAVLLEGARRVGPGSLHGTDDAFCGCGAEPAACGTVQNNRSCKYRKPSWNLYQ